MAKTPDDVNSGLGDITNVIHDQGVSDLSWLNVDVEEYRRLEALPKQNLDMIPELQGALAWDGKDDRVPTMVPVRPHATVNTNPLDVPEATLRSNSSVRDRLAEYVMEGMSDREIAKHLSLQFSPEQLRSASSQANEVLAEKGVLGNVYVNADHFPRCAQDGPHREFVAKNAKRALFVLAKEACTHCVCNKGGQCSSFKKRIVREVPYVGKVAAHYSVPLSKENRLSAEDAQALASSSAPDVKRHLQIAFQRPLPKYVPEGTRTIQYQRQVAAPEITEEQRREYEARRAAAASASPLPGPLCLVAAKRVMQGHADPSSLRASSDVEIRGLASEVGILGHTWLDGDALGGVGPSLAFVSSRKLSPDFVLLRRLSSSDLRTPEFAELSQVTNIVSTMPELGLEHLGRALERAVASGRVASAEAQAVTANVSNPDAPFDWRSLIAQVNLYVPREAPRAVDPQQAALVTPHYGAPAQDFVPVQLDPERVRQSISRMMNDGLSGRRLQSSVLSRYSRSDLARLPQVGAALSSLDGVQGSYFVDPTAYPDYGKGCSTGGDAFRRATAVQNVIAGSCCTGCRLQTHPGWCSKYAKTLIRQVPESVVAAAAERRRLPVVRDSAPVENPVERYELASEMQVDLGVKPKAPVEISISGQSVTD